MFRCRDSVLDIKRNVLDVESVLDIKRNVLDIETDG